MLLLGGTYSTNIAKYIAVTVRFAIRKRFAAIGERFATRERFAIRERFATGGSFMGIVDNRRFENGSVEIIPLLMNLFYFPSLDLPPRIICKISLSVVKCQCLVSLVQICYYFTV